jgi:hypothetical protein
MDEWKVGTPGTVRYIATASASDDLYNLTMAWATEIHGIANRHRARLSVGDALRVVLHTLAHELGEEFPPDQLAEIAGEAMADYRRCMTGSVADLFDGIAANFSETAEDPHGGMPRMPGEDVEPVEE